MYLKFVSDLFLEVTELVRFRESLDDNGFRKALLQDSVSFGLVKSAADTAFNNGRVERDVDNALNQKTIKIASLVAIDNEGQFIVNPQVNNLPVPADGNWYWLKISHQYSILEEGKVSLDASGNLTGVGTEFLKVLRGNPNFASVIKFSGSVGNTLEYEVVDITDDTHATIVHPAVTGGGNADFVAETDLRYKIVGTFTDGVAVPNDNKFPFQYDSCLAELVVEAVGNTRPTYVTGQEFFLARVRVSSGNLVIQDKRIEHWETKGSNENKAIERLANPLIGVETAKWQNIFNTGDRNIVEIAWGMRSTNWSVDSSQNIVTLFGSSQGGSFKTTDDFTDGDFNGWRIYTANGKYSKITNSIKQGSAINCYLDVLDVDNYSNDGGSTFTGNQVLVVPDCDGVEIRFQADPTDVIANVDDNDKFSFPVNTSIAKCLPTVFKDPTCKYIVWYRYKSFKEFTQWTPIASGSYYTEQSFNEDGSFKPVDERITFVYISDPLTAFIQLEISPDSWKRFKETVYKGDIIGVNTITSFAPGQVLDLQVGVSKRYQFITGDPSITGGDMYISLSRTNAVEGNEFRIHFDCNSLSLGGNKIVFADDYTSGTLTIVKEFTQGDAYAMLNQKGGICFDCVFTDTGKWIVYQNYDLESPLEVKVFSGDLDEFFETNGLGKKQGWFGYALMDGRNGTVDVTDRFILSTATNSQMGTLAGQDQVVLDLENVPKHHHGVVGKRASRNTTGGGFDIVQVYINGPADAATPGTETAPTTDTGGMLDGSTKPVVVKPKHAIFAYAQKLY